MKEDNGHFFDVEPVIDLEHFVELLLVTLANKDRLQPSFIDKRIKRHAILSTDYKKKIENTMYDEDSKCFTKLIDYFDYYEHQSKWEMDISECLKKYSDRIKYNFEFDYLEIEFTINEIKEILSKYDVETKETMEVFIYYSDIGNNDYSQKRHNNLIMKEIKRDHKRVYIRNSPTTFGKTWSKK